MTDLINPQMLIETAWKSLLCAGFVLLALWLLRRRSAAERSLLAHLGRAAIVMLPLAAAALPRLDIEAPRAVASAYRQVAPIVAAKPVEMRTAAPIATEAAPRQWHTPAPARGRRRRGAARRRVQIAPHLRDPDWTRHG